MGYNTQYTLNTRPESDDGTLCEMLEEASYFDGDDPLCYINGGDSCKWYEHESDMKAVSRVHPDVLFILDGDGEEAGDVWRKWFYRGKMYVWRPDVERPELDANGADKLGYGG